VSAELLPAPAAADADADGRNANAFVAQLTHLVGRCRLILSHPR
jgi:hypothetical protein